MDRNIKRSRDSFSEASAKVCKVDEEIDFEELVQDGNVSFIIPCIIMKIK